MRLIFTGTTVAGVFDTGLEILRAAIADIAVERSHKVQVITHNDFASYSPTLLDQIRDHDAFIWAPGKSSDAMTERDYVVLTRNWPRMPLLPSRIQGHSTHFRIISNTQSPTAFPNFR
ncbi:hypothetical protein BD410DRAFT_795898 [Rickenella mellea]|uniref:Uncharacterized protein n=1 Tax=Rickenella mellea TaxID=50990 RepID=A0A4Y7PM84_9AGAM|nr:hypothetical protein BD410DRAFT_795898 [Rickenella mellea]